MESLSALMASGATEAARLVGVGLSYETGANILPALGDPSVAVARAAYDRLIVARGPAARLESLMVAAETPGPAQLWALAVLARHHPVEIRPLWEALGSPLVELPGVPADVRTAIVRRYAPGTRDTDPRWLLEAALLPPLDDLEESDLIARAVAALGDAGLDPQQPISAAEEYRQGEGTYYAIETAAGTVLVSTLGRFFRTHGSADVDEIREALREFRHIDNALGNIIVDNLSVYDFGERKPMPVRSLLFNWQD